MNQDIFKICHLKDNKIYKIDVFNGVDEYDKQNVIDLHKSKTTIFDDYFDEEEIQTILDENIEVVYHNIFIFIDDSIETIKKKLISVSNLAFDEIYFFYTYRERLTAYQIFNNLTQNNKIPLTKNLLLQFILNINRPELFDNLADKEVYDYTDILKLDIHDSDLLINSPLGQTVIYETELYPITVNPFVSLVFTKENNQFHDLVKTNNKSLLLSNNLRKIHKNIIYNCDAKNVLTYIQQEKLSEGDCIKLYYPYLAKLEILSLPELLEKSPMLVSKSKELLDTAFERNYENIALFNEIYNKKTSDLDYIQKGILKLEFIMKPIVLYSIPLDIIFKTIHAEKNIPLIKFNPSKKAENIYRLYADNISTKGIKIPYLNKSKIFKLMKNIGRSKSVSCYITYIYKGVNIPIICTFNQDTSVVVSIELEKPISEEILDSIISDSVNPLIEQVKNKLAQSGFEISLFKKIKNSNIEIIDLTYSLQIDIKHNINISDNIGCLSSLFNVEQNNLKKGILMRFKKVANFSEMDSSEAYILDLFKKQDVEPEEIIKGLVNNFDMSETAARSRVAEVLRSADVVSTLYKTKQIKANTNPGFSTKITLENFTNRATIVMDGINNINYLSTIPTYLDSLLRITQNVEETEVSIEKINKLCLKKEIQDKEKIKEIDAIATISEEGELDEEEVDKSLFKATQPLEIGKIDIEDEDYDEELQKTFMMSDDEDSEDEDDDDQNGGADDDDEQESLGIELGSPVASPEQESLGIELGSPVASPEQESLGIELGSPVASPEQESLGIELGSPVASQKSDEESLGIELGSPVASQKSDEESLGIELGSPVASPEQDDEKEIETTEKELVEEIEKLEDKKTTPFQSILITKSKLPPKKTVKIDEPIFDIEKAMSKPKPTIKITTKPKASTEGNILKRDITGMSLSNPNPFEERLKKRAPKLFTYDLDGRYNGYNRICPANVRRQPVILTDNEKEKIDNEHPGSYKHAIKYGVPGGEKFWYICPRYWSLKDNTSLTEEEVNSGKYGNVIPFKGKDGKPIKSVPPNTSIFEFNAPQEHVGKKGEYIEHYPGFIKSDSHPDGYCLPCCFKQWDSKEQQQRREQCLEKEEGTPVKKVAKDVTDDYIKGSDKFPIQQKRMGFLPLVIQRFLKTDNQKCQVSLTNISLKQDHVCLLRQGVELSRTKSFIACIADIYGNLKGIKIPTIKEMQNIIIESLDVDNFIALQNGCLISLFYKSEDVIDLEEYKDSIIYSKTDLTNIDQKNTLTNIVSAFINFKKFLLSDDEIIDYTYLWDLVCKENKKLFPKGLNLIILEILDNDITDNINIICPTNHFSTQFFNVNKKTLILIKNQEYYEPIYAFEDKKTVLEVMRLFSLSDKNIMPNLKVAITNIKNLVNTNCMSLPSKPEVYKFKQNISCSQLVKIIKKTNYTIVNQVLNYNGKIIGLLVKKELSDIFYVPCLPSNAMVDLEADILFIDDVKWTSYNNTKMLLNTLSSDTDKKILCLPKIKVIEDELIVGIITETNQFISVVPEPNIAEDDLEVLTHSDFMIADKISIHSREKDRERIKLIKTIKLEKNFYDSFRNSIRILLGNPENSEIRGELESIINNRYLLYFDKLNNINNLIKELTGSAIQFILYNEVLLEKIEDINSCIVKDEEKCKKSNYCLFNDSNNCSLLIPKENLLTGKDNEIQYFDKIADELIRYNRIKDFVFKPQAFLSFSDTKYNLRENELLIIQSLLNSDYFLDLIPITDSLFISNTAYDSINPDISTKYAPVIDFTIKDDEEEFEELIDDEIEKPKIKKKLTITPKLKTAETIKDIKSIQVTVLGNLPEILILPTLVEDDIEQLEPIKEEDEELDEEDEEDINEITFLNCKREQKILTSKWREIFVKGVTVINYSNHSPFCSFQLLIEIITNFDPTIKIKSINHLKQIIVSQYQLYKLETYRIGNIWKLQGKITLGEKLLLGEIDIATAVMDETYYLTNLDLLLVIEYYKLPVVLLSATKLRENNKTFLVTNKNSDDNYYFILVSPIKTGTIQEYRIFIYNKDSQINLKNINLPMKTDIKISGTFDFQSYINPENPAKLKTKKIVEKLDDEIDDGELIKALETV